MPQSVPMWRTKKMDRMRHLTLVGLCLGTVIAAPAILIAIGSGGAGHGSYIAARVLFPFSMLLTLFEDRIGPVAIGAGLLQFPLYGVLIGRALALKSYGKICVVMATHVVAALACFSGLLSGF